MCYAVVSESSVSTYESKHSALVALAASIHRHPGARLFAVTGSTAGDSSSARPGYRDITPRLVAAEHLITHA